MFRLLSSFLILVNITNLHAQQFNSLNRTELLTQLFPGSTINSRQEAVWKPGYISQDIPVSDDGYCYTRQDSTIYFKGIDVFTGKMAEMAAVIFTTNNEQDCHACSPALGVATFIKNPNGQWRLNRFKPYLVNHGAYGKRGKIDVEQFSANLFCLRLDIEEYGQGNFHEYISLYSLSGKLNQVLSFESYSSNEGTGESNVYHEVTKMTKLQGQPPTIILEKNRDLPKSTTRKTYRYSQASEVFEPVK